MLPFCRFKPFSPLSALVLTSLLLAGCQPGAAIQDQGQSEGRDRDLTRLLLTWAGDPTSTTTIQWLEPGLPLPLMSGQSDDRPLWQMPEVGPVTLNAEAPAWLDEALKVGFLADANHQLPRPDDLAAEAYMAWNKTGVLVYVDVRDDAFVENPDDERLFAGDSIELFISDGHGSQERYQVVIAPGADPEQPSPRHTIYDHRVDPDEDALRVDYDVAYDAQGYRIEAHLPWANLGIDPTRGRAIAMQLYVKDQDERDGGIGRIGWHPAGNAAADPVAMYPLVLSEVASPAQYSRVIFDGDEVSIYANPALAGETARVTATELELASAEFELHEGRARARLQVPEPPRDHRWGALHAWVGDQRLKSVPLPASLHRSHAPEPAELVYGPYDEPQQQQHVQTQVSEIRDWPSIFRHRVELTGLEPDSAYRFTIEGSSRSLAFATMPETLDRPMRFAIGGDVRHSLGYMLRTNEVAMSHRPEFIVWGGDLAYADANPNRLNNWEEWFQANAQTLIDDDGFVTPILVGIGNHEVRRGYYDRHDDFEPTDAWRERIAPYFYSIFAFPGQPGYNVIDFGDYLSFIVLDSAHTNPIEGEQTQWLEQRLDERQDVPHVFPVYHVPAFPSHRPFEGEVSAAVREHWTPLFDRYGIRVAFENHDHTYKRTPPIRAGEIDPAGTVYLGDGAWGVRTRDVHDPEQTWYLEHAQSTRHAIIVTLDGDRQVYEVYSEDGELIDRYVEQRDRRPLQDQE